MASFPVPVEYRIVRNVQSVRTYVTELAQSNTPTVSVLNTQPGMLPVAVLLQVQNCSLLLGPVFEIKAAIPTSGNGVGRG